MNIGIIMPVYNQAQYLEAALDSVAAQDYQDKYCVAVNDGSVDSTAWILRRRAKIGVLDGCITHPENMGTAAAINTGFEFLTTDPDEFDALTWISSDNTMEPTWLSELAKPMEEKEAGVIYSGFDYLVPLERGGHATRYLHTPYDPTKLVKDQNCFFGPSFLIRTSVWLEAGLHRGKISHDYDHWLRVEEVCWRRGHPIVGLNRPLCKYLAHVERATVVRKKQYDADHWQAEAVKRRTRK